MTVATRAILERCSGQSIGTKAVLSAGGELTVGRTDFADVTITDDAALGGVHFALSWDGERCALETKGRAGTTLVNGEEVVRATLDSGDWIRAGATDFRLFVEDATVRPEEAQRRALARSEGVVKRALAQLRACDEPLYAVFDAARDMRIAELLHESVDPYVSLFEGRSALALAAEAPYLVAFAPASMLLERIVWEGWRRRWGVFLTTSRSRRDVRAHLRSMTMVEDEETGKELYFRFYDPQVFGVFVHSCSLRQRSQLLGPLTAWLFEGADGAVIAVP